MGTRKNRLSVFGGEIFNIFEYTCFRYEKKRQHIQLNSYKKRIDGKQSSQPFPKIMTYQNLTIILTKYN